MSKKNSSRLTSNGKQRLCIGLMATLLVVDQVVKILVKTHMQIGEDIPLIGNWCRLHFIENEGMAFGMTFGGDGGKTFLSLFRIVASAALAWLLVRLLRRDARTLTVVSLSLILVGAVGNLIDSCFYGLLFDDSYYHVAQFLPSQGGYARFLHGRVVDMFFFPLIDSTWPQWVPFVGGTPLLFFNAIFNVADSAITVGVVMLIADQLFGSQKGVENEKKAALTADEKQVQA